ncbi:MAG: thymidylate synthase [Deltaproteobacteria bacterium]|nr:thymidylate synthase [Deltaproteobacteria bacterium]
MEKSTRYVRFDQKNDQGEYAFYKEPKIMGSNHGPAYLRLMNLLFDTYSSQIDPMIEFVKQSLPIEEVELRHPQNGGSLTYGEARKDEKLKKWAESAYRSTVRAQACDILRSYLPAATLTNAGFFGNGQAFEYMVTKLYSHELTEFRELAASTHRELNELIPSFVKRARFNSYLADTHRATRALATEVAMELPVQPTEPVQLVDYDEQAEEKVISAILYPHSRHSLLQLRDLVRRMPEVERKKILGEYLNRRQHRRDRPGRALEQLYYTFDVLGNLGLYRDLQRHRILSQERQDYTTIHGYDVPPEMEEAGFKGHFDRCMEEAANLYEEIHRDLPNESQYVVPFAYKIRWYMKMNLREAVHIGELRTMPQGHPDYRSITQQMWRKIGEVHPALAEYAKFIDWKTYRLGRLSSEMRTEYKKSSLEK